MRFRMSSTGASAFSCRLADPPSHSSAPAANAEFSAPGTSRQMARSLSTSASAAAAPSANSESVEYAIRLAS